MVGAFAAGVGRRVQRGGDGGVSALSHSVKARKQAKRWRCYHAGARVARITQSSGNVKQTHNHSIKADEPGRQRQRKPGPSTITLTLNKNYNTPRAGYERAYEGSATTNTNPPLPTPTRHATAQPTQHATIEGHCPAHRAPPTPCQAPSELLSRQQQGKRRHRHHSRQPPTQTVRARQAPAPVPSPTVKRSQRARAPSVARDVPNTRPLSIPPPMPAPDRRLLRIACVTSKGRTR